MRVIVNPRADGGRAGRRWPRTERRLRSASPHAEVVLTAGPGHATELAREAARQGEGDVVAAGGDGLVNEVLNGLVADDALLQPGVRLTVLPLGSGCDFARSLSLPRGLEAVEGILASQTFRPVDVGRAEFVDLDGRERVRYFANLLEGGAGGEVMQRVNRSAKRLGGRAAFLGAILRTLLTYRNRSVEVAVDGTPVARGRLNGVIVANGRFYGRGLQPAPRAQVDDGLLDVVLFGDVGLRDALGSLGKLRKGTHLDHPKVATFQGEEVEARTDEVVLVEMDGEVVGALPFRARVLPRLLPVRVPEEPL